MSRARNTRQQAVPAVPRVAPTRRAGFTLLELLVSIIIISVLIALLLPAVGSARRSVRNAQVSTEISQFDTSISDFKATFGPEPPSGIILYETGEATDTNPMPATPNWGSHAGNETARLQSRSLIQRIWPNFDFTLNRDLNNDGDLGAAGEVFLLRGDECLVFFLGGMIVTAADTGEARQIGFAKNPANPFFIGTDVGGTANRIDAAEIDRSVRQGPFFEFILTRLVDTDGNGAPGYVDTLPSQTKPYLYLSSYEGQGYRPWGLDGKPGVAGVDDDGDTVVDNVSEIGYAGSDDELPAGTLQDVYRQGDFGTSTPWKDKSYQIISPGADGAYGVGRYFNPDTSQTDLAGARSAERDNITNFHSGPLSP